MASNTNYSSITDLLTSFTPIERPTRVHYNPFPEIERMNNTYRWYNYPGDSPKEEEVSEEETAYTPEASTSSTPSNNTTEQTVEEEVPKKEKSNLNDIIDSQKFKFFLSNNYNKYFEKFDNFEWNKNGNPQTYLNDIYDWLSNFTLTNDLFPIVTTTEYWDVDKFNKLVDLNVFKQYFNSPNVDYIAPLLRQTYITIWAVNDFLKQQQGFTNTPPPPQQATQSQNPTPGTTTGQDQDTDQVYREYLKTLGSLPYK